MKQPVLRPYLTTASSSLYDTPGKGSQNRMAPGVHLQTGSPDILETPLQYLLHIQSVDKTMLQKICMIVLKRFYIILPALFCLDTFGSSSSDNRTLLTFPFFVVAKKYLSKKEQKISSRLRHPFREKLFSRKFPAGGKKTQRFLPAQTAGFTKTDFVSGS